MAAGLEKAGLARLDAVLAGHVERDEAPGAAWFVARRGHAHIGTAGHIEVGDGRAVGPDTIFRISSMTKPITAVAALILVEECVLRLDDPIDPFLPELADRHVLVNPAGPLAETVPAERPLTLRDLLTFRMGLGMDFATADAQPVLEAMGALELGAGPPAPAGPPATDEWIRRLGTLPLSHQPGTRWLYHTSAEVLGVLVERAAAQPFEVFLKERIFEPLGMRDTAFFVPATLMDRFGASYFSDPSSGERHVYDPADGQWSMPPAFPSGGHGLVSTLIDYAAFAEMLLDGGVRDGVRILSRPTIESMTSDHLTSAQRTGAGPDPTGAQGWGFGVGVQTLRTGPTHSVGTYGWDGGMGSSWANDPTERLVGILLTNQMWTSPTPPPICTDFWTATYAAIAD
jgi:CubicO group peptidase (beta-lactamase class C family)